MKNILTGTFVVCCAITLSACESSHTIVPNKLVGLELQQLQSREFEAPYDVTFASTISVLQDAGYIIEAADKNTGLITAKSPTNSHVTYNLFWGLGHKMGTTKVSAFLETAGKSNSKVRLNFVSITNHSQIYGQNSEVDTPIEDAKIYANAFEKIDQANFVRLGTK